MDIDTYLAKRAELQKLLEAHGKEMLQQLFSAFFAEAPEVKTVTWTQYTPYFNDGDPCVFGINDPGFSIKFPEDIKGDQYEETKDWVNTYSNPSENPAFKTFLSKFSDAEAILESLGDHAEVTVTNRPDGIVIEVEEYEHD